MTDLIQRYNFVKRAFGSTTKLRDDGNVSVTCPNPACQSRSDERKKKFAILLTTGGGHCWVCGLKTKHIAWVLSRFGKRSLADESIEIFGEYRESTLDNEIIPVTLPKGFKLLSLLAESRDPDVRSAIKYLKNRGIDERAIWRYRLGIADFPHKHRIIIPSFDSNGALNYYTGRAYRADVFPKYNNPGTKRDTIIFNEIDIDWTKEVTLVEGPFDLMKAGENAIPVLGCHISVKSSIFAQIVSNGTPVVLALDPDASTNAGKIARLLSSYCIPVRNARIPVGEDPGSLDTETFAEIAKKAPKWDRWSEMRRRLSMVR